MSLSTIPDDFGKGGANISDGTPTLRSILREHKTAIEAGGSGTDQTARDAAAAAQSTADGAVAVNGTQATAITAALALAEPLNVFSANLPDADATVDYTVPKRIVRAPSGTGTYTGPHTVTLDPTNAPTRQEITILTESANGLSRIMTVVNGGVGGGTLLAFDVTTAWKAVFLFDGTNWFLDRQTRLVA